MEKKAICSFCGYFGSEDVLAALLSCWLKPRHSVVPACRLFARRLRVGVVLPRRARLSGPSVFVSSMLRSLPCFSYSEAWLFSPRRASLVLLLYLPLSLVESGEQRPCG